MLSRARTTFVLLPLLGFFLAPFQFTHSPSFLLDTPADEQEVNQAPAPANVPSQSIYVIALDKDGRPVTDLKPEEVSVREDKVEQKVVSVVPAASEPLTIGLFFDISGSRRADRSIPDEAQLTREFVHAIWHEGDTAFVLAFNNQMHPAAQPTHNLEVIDEGLSKIPQATYFGSTALYDALCIVKLEKLNQIPGRKVYVALSDFEDNSSRSKLEDVIALGRETHLAIFPMILGEAFGGGHSKLIAKRVKSNAQKIAEETGGEVLSPESPKLMPAIFSHLGAEIQAAYCITYNPSSSFASGGKRKLRIETTRQHVKLLFPRT